MRGKREREREKSKLSIFMLIFSIFSWMRAGSSFVKKSLSFLFFVTHTMGGLISKTWEPRRKFDSFLWYADHKLDYVYNWCPFLYQFLEEKIENYKILSW